MTGTGSLLRLFLRISRRWIVIWTVAVFALVAASLWALSEAYPDQQALDARAMLLGNPAAVMMTGPAFALDDYTFGAMVANELMLWVLLPVAIMSVVLTVRHTRAEEESGRLEMLRALPVSRHAPALAAMATVAIANLAMGVAVSAALLITDMPTADSLAFGAATAATGLVFGAIAAIAAHITEHARTASGAGLGVIAIAFLVRGLGDVIDRQGSWLSWLSPFAWAQQTKVFVELRWWPIGVSLLVLVVLLAVAVGLARGHDVGAGLRAAHPGAARARSYLTHPAGLTVRLQLGTFIGWAIGLFCFAVAMGMLANSLEDMLTDMPEVTDWVDLNLADLTRSFAAVILAFLSIGPIALIVAGVLRLRAEETAGRVETMLAAGTSRLRLTATWTAVVTALALIVQLLLGFGVGVGVALGTGEVFWVGELTLAAFAYWPVIVLFGAVALAAFGLIPRASSVAWILVVWAAIVVFLAGLLNLPQWAVNLSPLAHVPLVPDADTDGVAVAWMLGAAVVLAVLGGWGMRRRDLISH